MVLCCAVLRLLRYGVVDRKDHVNGCDGSGCMEERTRRFVGVYKRTLICIGQVSICVYCLSVCYLSTLPECGS